MFFWLTSIGCEVSVKKLSSDFPAPVSPPLWSCIVNTHKPIMLINQHCEPQPYCQACMFVFVWVCLYLRVYVCICLCVCVCVCECVCICVCMFACLCVFVCVCLYLWHLCERVCICVRMFVFVFVCACLYCLYLCVRVFVFVWECLYLCVHVCICVFVCACTCLRVLYFILMCLCVCVCICVCICVCMFVFVWCVSVFVFVCACLYLCVFIILITDYWWLINCLLFIDYWTPYRYHVTVQITCLWYAYMCTWCIHRYIHHISASENFNIKYYEHYVSVCICISPGPSLIPHKSQVGTRPFPTVQCTMYQTVGILYQTVNVLSYQYRRCLIRPRGWIRLI